MCLVYYRPFHSFPFLYMYENLVLFFSLFVCPFTSTSTTLLQLHYTILRLFLFPCNDVFYIMPPFFSSFLYFVPPFIIIRTNILHIYYKTYSVVIFCNKFQKTVKHSNRKPWVFNHAVYTYIRAYRVCKYHLRKRY